MKKYRYTILLVATSILSLPFIGGQLIDVVKDDMAQVIASFQAPPKEEIEKVPNGEIPKDVANVPQTDTETNAGTEPEMAPGANTDNKVPPQGETAPPAFHQVKKSYFNDALFIGDSRTIGLSEYADLGEADVFADSGLSVYKAMEDELKVDGVGKTSLKGLLHMKKYGKVYIMLGINELGYDFEQTVKQYRKLVSMVREMQPDAIVFLQANLHVTKAKSNKEKIFNNKNINKINQKISKMADNISIFYIDVNEIFDDSEGTLQSDLTNDGSHVLGKYYSEWADWIRTKGI